MPEPTTPTGPAQPPTPQPPSSGPLLSYNVPQQVTYSGQNYIELRLDRSDFLATASAPTGGQR